MKDLLEIPGLMDSMDTKDLMELLVQMVPLDMMVYPDLMDMTDSR